MGVLHPTWREQAVRVQVENGKANIAGTKPRYDELRTQSRPHRPDALILAMAVEP